MGVTKQKNKENQERGVRGGIWLATFAAFALVIILVIFMFTGSPPDHLPPSTLYNDTIAEDAEAREIAFTSRLRAQRRQQAQLAPDYVYQGRTLSQWIDDLSSTDQLTRKTAHDAFRSMGADASPAIPGIAELLHSSGNRNAAAWALALIGTNSLPTLIDALTNGNRAVRIEVAGAIGYMRDVAEEAVPALVECLRHEDASVRANAIAALQAIPKHADLTVPALTVCLTDVDAGVRGNAATVIRNFGRAAVTAIPILVRVAKEDNDHHVRTRAAESLRAISPERADAEKL